MDKQARAKGNLNLRAAGRKDAKLLAVIQQGAILHLVGDENSAGYAEVYVNGWKDTDAANVYCESLADEPASVAVILAERQAFQPTAGTDGYGRIPGNVSGFVFKALTEALE